MKRRERYLTVEHQGMWTSLNAIITHSPSSLDVKKPFTQNYDLMDDMFDATLLMKSFGNHRDREMCEEEGEERKTLLSPPLQDLDADAKRIDIFPAYPKALQFFYLRFLLHANIYDLPMLSLTVEDVDRLSACGMIAPEYFDHIFLVSMLGHGLFRRYLKVRKLAQIDNSVAPQSGFWTTPVGTYRPSRKEIFQFIAACENFRFRRPYARPGFRLASFERPVLTPGYINRRIQRDGYFGLKRMTNLSDEDAGSLFDHRDRMFVPPDPRLDKIRSDMGLGTRNVEEDIALILGLKNAPWEGESDLDDEDMKFYSTVATSLESLERTDNDHGTAPKASTSPHWPIYVPSSANWLPARSISAYKSRKDRPSAQFTNDPKVLYDPYFDKFFNRPEEGRELCATDYIIHVHANGERSPKYEVRCTLRFDHTFVGRALRKMEVATA